MAPGSNRPLAAALRLHFEEVRSESFVHFSLVNDGVNASTEEPWQPNAVFGRRWCPESRWNLRLHQLSARTLEVRNSAYRRQLGVTDLCPTVPTVP